MQNTPRGVCAAVSFGSFCLSGVGLAARIYKTTAKQKNTHTHTCYVSLTSCSWVQAGLSCCFLPASARAEPSGDRLALTLSNQLFQRTPE